MLVRVDKHKLLLLQKVRKLIYNGYTYTMKTTRNFVSATAKFTASMEIALPSDFKEMMKIADLLNCDIEVITRYTKQSFK